jgi:poly(3-hydroxyalkanoate) synthetase
MTEQFKTTSPRASREYAFGDDEPARRHDAGVRGPTAFPFAAMPFLWPLHIASSINESASSILKWYSDVVAGVMDTGAAPPEPVWSTPSRVALTLPTMRLRDFSTGRDDVQPALICAPYALHGATIADFAPGHSIVEALRVSGLARLAITEWRSAEPDMRYFSIDTYLADLNVAVDELGAPVDLIGLCQGGWMALVYAARFPEKVRRLVLVGAPVDVRAAQSLLMQAVDELPLSTFENLVRLGEGRLLGRYALKLWGSASAVDDVARILQIAPGERDVRLEALKKHFTVWHAWTVDLPGVYYMQVVQKVFKDNQIAEGRFVALGSTVDLRTVRAPMYLLAGRDDEIVDPEQLFAVVRLASTPRGCIEKETAPCGHIGLFMGADTIAGAWPRIARWLSRDISLALAS